MGRLWHAGGSVGMVGSKVAVGSESRGRADSSRSELSARRLEELGIPDAGQEFVGKVCASLRRQGMTLDRAEMMAFGFAGLVEAAERFDPSHGVEFRAYAYYRVRGAIIDGMRKMGPLSRRGYQLMRALRALNEATGEEVATADSSSSGSASSGLKSPPASNGSANRAATTKEPYLALREKLSSAVSAMTVSLYTTGSVTEEAGLAAIDSVSAEDRLRDFQLAKLIRELLLELPEPERSVLRRHYVEDASFEDIALEMDVSRSWVCRIHGRGVRRLGLRVRASL